MSRADVVMTIVVNSNLADFEQPTEAEVAEFTAAREAGWAASERIMGRMWLANRPDAERNQREFPDLYGPFEEDA